MQLELKLVAWKEYHLVGSKEKMKVSKWGVWRGQRKVAHSGRHSEWRKVGKRAKTKARQLVASSVGSDLSLAGHLVANWVD